MFWRSWVRIPSPYTGWTFSPYIIVKIVMLFEKTKNKWNQRPGWPIYKKVDLIAKHEIITLRLLFQNWSKKGFFIKNVDLMVDKSFWMKSPWKCWLMIASICFGKKLKSFFLLFFFISNDDDDDSFGGKTFGFPLLKEILFSVQTLKNSIPSIFIT